MVSIPVTRSATPPNGRFLPKSAATGRSDRRSSRAASRAGENSRHKWHPNRQARPWPTFDVPTFKATTGVPSTSAASRLRGTRWASRTTSRNSANHSRARSRRSDLEVRARSTSISFPVENQKLGSAPRSVARGKQRGAQRSALRDQLYRTLLVTPRDERRRSSERQVDLTSVNSGAIRSGQTNSMTRRRAEQFALKCGSFLPGFSEAGHNCHCRPHWSTPRFATV